MELINQKNLPTFSDNVGLNELEIVTPVPLLANLSLIF
uniref:Uncharacterized protein n=1 Tax=Anguilla anguilla TaxID=7936 RepID=A0A0E9WJ04_ANGAN